MSFIHDAEQAVENFIKKVTGFLTSPKAKSELHAVASLLPVVLPIVAEFAGLGFIPASVAALVAKYGGKAEEVTKLAETFTGDQLEAAVKTYIGKVVADYVAKHQGVRTTVAQIARDIAYLQASDSAVKA